MFTNTTIHSVSVVIPFYGDPASVEPLIAQILPQVGEVIIADDSSPTPFPPRAGITVVRRERNGGFGAACNSGAAVAKGDYLLFLNSDVEVDSKFVCSLYEAANPWQPCVAGARLEEGSGTNASARRFPTAREHVAEWLVPLARFHDQAWMSVLIGHDEHALQGSDTIPTEWLVGAVLLLPRADFEAIGGFDERFYMNSEEIDLQRRLRNRGVLSVFIPHVRVKHVGGGSSDPALRQKWVVDSWRRYSEKWGGSRRLRTSLTVATIVNFGWNTLRHGAGRPTTPVQTLISQWDAVWGDMVQPVGPENEDGTTDERI